MEWWGEEKQYNIVSHSLIVIWQRGTTTIVSLHISHIGITEVIERHLNSHRQSFQSYVHPFKTMPRAGWVKAGIPWKVRRVDAPCVDVDAVSDGGVGDGEERVPDNDTRCLEGQLGIQQPLQYRVGLFCEVTCAS